MKVDDRNTSPDASFVRQSVTLHRASVAASQADVLVASFRPGFDFEIVDVQAFANGVTATASYMVKIGATNALAAATTPTADTRGSAALHATAANRRGTASEDINLHVTTNGTGAFADLSVIVTFRSSRLRP